MGVRIYSYGMREPFENGQAVIDQLFAANRYRNKLVECERARRDAVVAARRRLFPGYDDTVCKIEAIESDLAAARERLKAIRRAAKKLVKPPQLMGEIKGLTDQLAELRPIERAQRLKINGRWNSEMEAWEVPPDPALVEAKEAIYRQWQSQTKELYNGTNSIAWGTKLILAETVKQSDVHGSPPPRFQRSYGTGRIAVQIQSTKPLRTEEIYGMDNRVRLTEVDWQGTKYRRISTLSFRIGSNPDKSPIWARGTVLLHRRLPPGTIKWVWILRRKVGIHFYWYVQFVVQLEHDPTPIRGPGHVGVDLGWRMVANGLRVAVWSASDGSEGELVIPQKKLDDLQYVSSIRSERDLAFNDVRERFAMWLTENNGILPEYMREMTKHIRQWRSSERLNNVVAVWKNNRFNGDEGAIEWMTAWSDRDQFKFDEERHIERRTVGWRNDFYRCFFKRMARDYGMCKTEKVKWTDLSRNPEPGDEKIPGTNRKIASPGKITQILGDYFEMFMVTAKNNTATCHECKGLCDIDGKEVMHTCEHCGETWDIDYNAARNSRDTEDRA